MHSRYQLLIFDWDGTLVDSNSAIISCLQRTAIALELEIPSSETIQQTIGQGLGIAYQSLFPHALDKYQAFVQLYQYHSLMATPYKEILFPGVYDSLINLKQQGYLLAVATGKSRLSLNAALQQLQMHSLFSMTRTVDEAFAKPHPKMVEDILETLLVAPENSLLIGDTEYDMQLAKNAGIDAVAVTCGVHDAGRLLSHVPRACLADIVALNSWLELDNANPLIGQ